MPSFARSLIILRATASCTVIVGFSGTGATF